MSNHRLNRVHLLKSCLVLVMVFSFLTAPFMEGWADKKKGRRTKPVVDMTSEVTSMDQVGTLSGNNVILCPTNTKTINLSLKK